MTVVLPCVVLCNVCSCSKGIYLSFLCVATVYVCIQTSMCRILFISGVGADGFEDSKLGN